MDRRDNRFDERIAYWRRHLTALEPKSESALLQIASDAQRAENPMNYLNTCALDLYNRLRGLDDSSDEEMDVIPVATTGRMTGASQKEEEKSKEKSKNSEDSTSYTGLFSGTSLSASDRAAILGSGDDSALQAKLEKARVEASKPFNDATSLAGGKTFTCGGNSGGYSASSAKRHVEAYVADHGFPSGTSSMADLRKSLFQAASALVDAGKLGSKGFGTCATYQVNDGFSWNLIIEKTGTSGKDYSIEHADINGLY